MAKMDLAQKAAKYKVIMLQIKELEKEASPFKKELTEYAKSVGVEESIEIGGVTVERRVSVRNSIDNRKVTPDWLYRWQQVGYTNMLDISVNKQASILPEYDELLTEVDYEEKESISYAVRI